MPFRAYPAAGAKRVVILLHGISEDSKYLHPMAEFISESGLAHVYAPDLRGYGATPIRRGDLDYTGQLEDDLADLIAYLQGEHPGAEIVMAGHSAGGGTAIRFAAGRYGELASSYLLLAPLIGFMAPTRKASDGSESALHVNVRRIVKLTILNKLGIHRFDNQIVMKINRDPETLHGTETLELSHRLLVSRAPNLKYSQDLLKLRQPTLMLIGEQDEVFEASQYPPLFAEHVPHAVAKVIPGADHDGVLSDARVFAEVKRWMESL